VRSAAEGAPGASSKAAKRKSSASVNEPVRSLATNSGQPQGAQEWHAFYIALKSNAERAIERAAAEQAAAELAAAELAEAETVAAEKVEKHSSFFGGLAAAIASPFRSA
jgi:hypothetical protein